MIKRDKTLISEFFLWNLWKRYVTQLVINSLIKRNTRKLFPARKGARSRKAEQANYQGARRARESWKAYLLYSALYLMEIASMIQRFACRSNKLQFPISRNACVRFRNNSNLLIRLLIVIKCLGVSVQSFGAKILHLVLHLSEIDIQKYTEIYRIREFSTVYLIGTVVSLKYR